MGGFYKKLGFLGEDTKKGGFRNFGGIEKGGIECLELQRGQVTKRKKKKCRLYKW